MNLLELKKYAIDHRVEIKFGDPQNARECVISSRGQVKIPGEDKDFRVEEALDATEYFEIIGSGNAQRFTREAMTKTVADASGKKTSKVSDDEEE